MIYSTLPYPFGIGSVAKVCVIRACLAWDPLARAIAEDIFQCCISKTLLLSENKGPITSPLCLENNFFNKYQFTT